MMKSIKKMILMAGASTLVAVSLAAPAMAAEVQDHPNNPSPVDEEPYKDPGIRLCDITPTECEDTDAPWTVMTPMILVLLTRSLIKIPG
jgi:hypothetical protein